ncbi:UvrD-helicase domain-containing protein [Psychrobacillus sp. BL-248-WT-3]|uniref:UvrD-helicase domain-containing protein n=1 Tax=Psychrobacillus sp. BL-248-WT-3 TaxID=2725306 RepID=UPI00146D56FB|nr:UvrD-helicase domain-containing protein [Psychrobacillus sp. BL-248-WT-3]NME06220.1 UvrD-helicase domain-containing protein [Psychrobacillus sp. BL-248-WT-3]
MFFPVKSNGYGYSEEELLFSLLKSTFEKENAFTFQQLPINTFNEAFRYEPDILFFHQQLGMFIFEVKSYKINQIKGVRGTNWLCEGKQGSFTVSPQKQVENQMFHTRNILNQRCMLHNLFNTHAFVVLPNISYAEWDAREDLQKEYIKRPILKDDLLNEVVFYETIQTFANRLKLRPLDDLKWQDVLDYFMIPSKHESNSYAQARFSELHLLNTIPEGYADVIQTKLSQGLKIYVLSQQTFKVEFKETFCQFIDNFQLLIYEESTKTFTDRNEFILDGDITDDRLKELEDIFLNFNTGQFAIIHAPYDRNIMVSAGAGTGKTHVMVDRILFLLLNEQIPLSEISMITFTNDSTSEMKLRLENRLLTLYKLTNQAVFLNFAEDVSSVEISTIHSFAKGVLQSLAHELGYGTDISIRSFKYEKQKIIFEILDEYFSSIAITDFLNTKIRYYNFVTILLNMWEEMEKKGLSLEEIKDLDFGQANHTLLQNLIIEVFRKCECKLEKVKKAHQSITMGDLIRKLKTFTENDKVLKQLAPGKYLFVDEFQDSDDVQIEFIAKLQEILDYKIFVVGDIKQAIYRFRGSDYRAFSELIKRSKKTFLPYTLHHNYRTSETLLKRMHGLFTNWGRSENQDLTYNEKDCLTSNIHSYTNEWHIKEYSYSNMDAVNSSLLQEHVRQLKGKEKLAILVRTNNQARTMKILCTTLDIPTIQNLDGQFYLCDAVKHLHILLLALQYADQPMYVIEALQTPYFGYELNNKNFIATQGNKNRLKQFLNEHVKQNFSKYAELVRDYSPLTLIQMIMREENFYVRIENYYKQQQHSEQEVHLQVQRYKLNMQHLLTIIEQQFATNTVTIPIISNWLEIQMKTNRTENEPTFESDTAQVVISTVHRSKGLQYHTIFLPITNKPYNTIKPKYFIQDGIDLKEGIKRQFGWRIENFQNNYFNLLKDTENNEARKEEVRLLYVALTRAEQKVIITLPSNNINNSWSELLKEADILGGIRR